MNNSYFIGICSTFFWKNSIINRAKFETYFTYSPCIQAKLFPIAKQLMWYSPIYFFEILRKNIIMLIIMHGVCLSAIQFCTSRILHSTSCENTNQQMKNKKEKLHTNLMLHADLLHLVLLTHLPTILLLYILHQLPLHFTSFSNFLHFLSASFNFI